MTKTVCMLSLLCFTTLAFGANVQHKTKINKFEAVGGENPNADGQAMLTWKSNEGTTTVHITLTDFTPNTTYDFAVVSPTAGEADSCDVLVTNSHGVVHYQGTIAGDLTDADVLIYLSDDCSFSEDEIRAVGAHPDKSFVRTFTPVNGENASANGRAVLRYDANHDQTDVRIFISGFTSNTVYDLDVFNSDSNTEAVSCDVLHTNNQGRDQYRTKITGNVTFSDILIYLSADCSFSEDELRAVGEQAP